MRYSSFLTKLKSTFGSLVCEFTAKIYKGGIVSKCRCNIYTIESRAAGNPFRFNASGNRKFFYLFPNARIFRRARYSLMRETIAVLKHRSY